MSNAIIKTGGKQFSVETGQTLRVPSISDKNEGDKVDIEALFVNTDGKINLGGATVKATVVGHGRADKRLFAGSGVCQRGERLGGAIAFSRWT